MSSPRFFLLATLTSIQSIDRPFAIVNSTAGNATTGAGGATGNTTQREAGGAARDATAIAGSLAGCTASAEASGAAATDPDGKEQVRSRSALQQAQRVLVDPEGDAHPLLPDSGREG